MDERPIEFVGEVVFSRWYFVRELHMRIKVETSDTHYRHTGQPAHQREDGDFICLTYLAFLQECHKIGSGTVGWQDYVADFLGHLFWFIAQPLRRQTPFVNVGLLLHPNPLRGTKAKRQ